MAAPIQISAAWFPPNERTRATGISQMANALGVGVSFFLSNLIVSKDDESLVSSDDIRTLLSVYSGVSWAIFLLVIVYFPSQAPTPPSISSQEERMSVVQGLKNIIRDRYDKNFFSTNGNKYYKEIVGY